jgi:hypothetical protein
MSNGRRLSRGDNRRNARLTRLRQVLPREHAILALDLADDKQVFALTDHDSRVLARRTVRCRPWQLGEAIESSRAEGRPRLWFGALGLWRTGRVRAGSHPGAHPRRTPSGPSTGSTVWQATAIDVAAGQAAAQPCCRPAQRRGGDLRDLRNFPNNPLPVSARNQS